nr:oligosaccharide flippase family protein [Rheinheimera sp. SA_1]
MNSVIWNSGSQLYMALVAIMVIPVFTNFFGPSVYGLIAFSVLLQSIMNMLDLGFSALLSRESSRYRSGIGEAAFFKSLLHHLKKIFLILAVFIFSLFFFGSDFVAKVWLNSDDLEPQLVNHCIQLIALILSLRWICIYYRSLVFGLDALRWLAVFNVSITTLKFLVIIPLMYFWDFTIVEYFAYQLMIQLFELVLLVAKTNKLLNFADSIEVRPLSKAEYAQTFSFCIAVGVSTLLWIATTQVDKIYVSAMSELADFSFFYIAVTVAGVITVMTAPMINAALPKVTILYSSGSFEAISHIFGILLTSVTVLVLPTCAITFLYGAELLSIWSNEPDFVAQVNPILKWYVLGNSVLAIASVSYVLNFAAGDLRLRNLSSLFLLVCIVVSAPIGIYFAGVEGCSWAWCISVIIYFFVWQPVLIGKFSKFAFRNYVFVDFVPAICAVTLISYVLEYSNLALKGTAEVVVTTSAIWVFLTLIAALSSKTFRKFIEHWIKSHYA